MNKDKYLDLYHQMVLIRRVEERAAELYQQGKIGGFLHLYIGQEAVSTGLIAARKPYDHIITAYRDHGVAINAGISARAVMGELLGKATGISKGKGGSLHLFNMEDGFMGTCGIVAGGLPLATGAALALKMNKKDDIVVGFVGDGSSTEGACHEVLNMAAIWELPVLFVCEKTNYSP